MNIQRREIFQWLGAGVGAATLPAQASAGLLSPPVPTLPQHDSLWGNLLRNTELGSKKLTYLWTTNGPNLKGAPIAFGLPLDELPSLEWLILAIGEIVRLIANLLAALPASARERDPGLTAQVEHMRVTLARVDERHRALIAGQAGSTWVQPGVAVEVAGMQQEVLGLASQVPALAKALTQQVGDAAATAADAADPLARYKALYRLLPLPSDSPQPHSDELFAHWRVAGPNPMLLKRVGSLPAHFPLTEAQYAKATGGGDTLAAALSQKRAYLLDHVELGSMAPSAPTHKALTGVSHNHAPMALFVVPPGGRALMPVAIQCGQSPVGRPMFLRASSPDSAEYWGWQMAKTVVQTADFCYHEMFTHLGRTHLVSEACCVATHRCLPSSHPLHALLVPHFEGDLWVNLLAALIIMSPGTFGDIILGPPLQALQEGAVRDRLAFDFEASMPPAELRKRGLDDRQALPEHPYRDDALLLWDAIKAWVSDYIAVYYPGDSDVRNDRELAAWANELVTRGRLQGFKPIVTRQQLIDVVAMVVFTASAQHAAVNFPQRDEMSYAPLFAGNSPAPAPNRTTGWTEADWLRQLPGPVAAATQVHFLSMLGGIRYRLLGEYRHNRFPHGPVLKDPRVQAPLARFRARLVDIEREIEARNAHRLRPYLHLLPSRIPCSTHI